MGDQPFFYATAVDDVNAAIDLAIFYRCDPFAFLERPSSEVMEIYRLTKLRMKQLRDDD